MWRSLMKSSMGSVSNIPGPPTHYYNTHDSEVKQQQFGSNILHTTTLRLKAEKKESKDFSGVLFLVSFIHFFFQMISFLLFWKTIGFLVFNLVFLLLLFVLFFLIKVLKLFYLMIWAAYQHFLHFN